MKLRIISMFFFFPAISWTLRTLGAIIMRMVTCHHTRWFSSWVHILVLFYQENEGENGICAQSMAQEGTGAKLVFNCPVSRWICLLSWCNSSICIEGARMHPHVSLSLLMNRSDQLVPENPPGSRSLGTIPAFLPNLLLAWFPKQNFFSLWFTVV